jgi:guanylate kinase
MKGRLYVVSGPSGAGKGTICKEFLLLHPEVHFSVSCATRAPRPGEVDGVHYYFITREAFLARRAAGDFLECAEINGDNWYGTPRSIVMEKLDKGQNVLLEIENNGAQQVIRYYPDTVGVFILPPDTHTLIRRLVGRGTEDMERLTRRILKVPSELEAAKGYDALIINDEVDRAVAQLGEVMAGTYVTGQRERDTLSALTRDFADPKVCLELLERYYTEGNK